VLLLMRLRLSSPCSRVYRYTLFYRSIGERGNLDWRFVPSARLTARDGLKTLADRASKPSLLAKNRLELPGAVRHRTLQTRYTQPRLCPL